MRPNRRFSLTAVLASGLLLLPLMPSPVFSQASAMEIQEAIDGDTLLLHVERLARTPRPPATETEFAAAVYVENALRSYGYQTVLQPFTYYTYREPSALSLSVEGWKGAAFEARGFTYGPNGIGTGEIADCGLGTAADFQSGKARGKIALVRRGSTTFAEKVRQAAAAGAVAAIVWNDRDDALKGTLGEPLDMSVPVIMLSKQQGERLREQMKKQAVKATVKVDGGLSIRQTSYNIVATRKPESQGTGQIVLVTAHHDSAVKSPGANNGASGVAVLLEVARLLADKPTDTEVRLVSFGAASAGEQGPIAFVEGLTEKETKAMVAAYCLDAVGSVDAGVLTVSDPSGSRNVPVTLAEANGAVFSTAWNDRAEASGDHLPLAAAGIPVAFLTRAPSDAWRDQPEDTIEKISADRLIETAETVYAAVAEMTDPQTPAYAVSTGKISGGKTLEREAVQ
ncbi:M28 family peptidase [Brevibacillus brevis]|uniref:M28 family peptidase n=1 Tax=Brevibacillus brevis TaxID=1393 RepID=A0ABY9TD05_BREBE|nr:M28 family peptidase [Brevibacillus brevis]WNC17106.1 M28 family peptidase [Brevibacillus brevis]